MTDMDCEVCQKPFMVDRLPYPHVCPRCRMEYGEKWWHALTRIASCPDGNSIENCHNLMSDIAIEGMITRHSFRQELPDGMGQFE